MTQSDHIELYKQLKKTNCRDCGVQTCMAFALAVIRGERDLDDCPHLDEALRKKLRESVVIQEQESGPAETIGALREALADVDFSLVANKLGAELVGDRLRISCLGKDFIVDKRGEVESLVHINEWVMMPLLKYIIKGGHKGLSGQWIAFDQLVNGPSMSRYFGWRCEEPMRKLAESHRDIFFDLITIFGGKEVSGFSADYARVIHPLPKVPFLLLYSGPEDEFESRMQILFDKQTNDFLDTHSVYVLGRGIVEMFKKIMARHEEVLPTLLAL